jgi:exopolyphosphatase / guanosine-5'-triphosphate,3'-diphosphate pyrophosphatase
VQRNAAGPADRPAERPAAARGPIGVIDVGSNTARLVIFEGFPGGSLRAIDQRKELPRLGLDTGPDGSLSGAAMARGIAALERFAAVLRSLDSPRTLAVATSAVRDAPNAPEFLHRVQQATGMSLRILSGTEEGRYAYLGVCNAWQLDDALVCDLGGGSLQIVEVRAGKLRNSVSLPLGALRLTQRFLHHDPPRLRELDELRSSVRETVRSALAAFGGSGRYDVYAVGGSIRALARASIDLREYPIARVHGFDLRERDLEALYEILAELPASQRRALPGIGADRVDVIVAGLVAFQELLRATRAPHIVVSGTGIREGIALEVLGAPLPARADELVLRSVEGAAQGIALDLAHGEAVASVAAALFDLLAARRGWGPPERRALTVAALMHDAGIAIDLWRHARHSAYIIRNYPMWGLDHREVLLASMAAYLHEGDSAPATWRKSFHLILRPTDLHLAEALGALLQVAELLAPGAPRFTLAASGKALTIEFGEGADLRLGPRALEKARKPLERVLELEVRARDL